MNSKKKNNLNSSSKQKGNSGEEIAVKKLVENGYKIIERNYHYGNKGEIDIIAEKDNFLIFVEVKARWNDLLGKPEEAITKNKIAQIRKVAQAYLYEKGISNCSCRFDVIAIEFSSNNIRYEHYENAFQ